jgi:hypothetical protein
MIANKPGIKGLTYQEDYVLNDDTPPTGCQVRFSVEKIFMPFLSKERKERVYENFVYINWVNELGRSTGRTRVNDEVKFNPDTGKWDIISLDIPERSHINLFQAEWNLFYDGQEADVSGTPLALLFPYNPTRDEVYKPYHITTIEQLQKLSDSDCQQIGMGARDDRDKAIKYMNSINGNIRGIEFNAAMAEKDSEITSLRGQLADLSEKFSKFMASQEAKESSGGLTPAQKRAQTNAAKKADSNLEA